MDYICTLTGVAVSTPSLAQAPPNANEDRLERTIRRLRELEVHESAWPIAPVFCGHGPAVSRTAEPVFSLRDGTRIVFD
jgi:hypothetical protein